MVNQISKVRIPRELQKGEKRPPTSHPPVPVVAAHAGCGHRRAPTRISQAAYIIDISGEIIVLVLFKFLLLTDGDIVEVRM
ncbi:hypothetical protein GUJ93_ZPchr0007g5948 [Zizania palustris]|uniref:Uncharacterized protein n=1 Tax=Zizania palustris TaxID=103762 RepID=A0A8J5SUT7_ZIZPA|nr:hypothetical protein GUJ93_ZPchr0007g5948 [Zizania palustris]